jgi:hypothetical protein
MAKQSKARMIELQARAVDGGPEPDLDDVEIGRWEKGPGSISARFAINGLIEPGPFSPHFELLPER